MKHNWTYKKLGEVVTIERGGSPRPIQDYITTAENGLNWIKIGDAVEGSKYITSTKEKIKPEGLKKTRFVHKGDFILSNSMSFGRPYILAIDGCIHDGWLVLHDENQVFDKSYLYYYLSSPSIYEEFKRLAVGGVVNNLNSDIVRKVKVAIPSLSEQESIVAELDGINHLIDLQEEQLREYDRLAQSLFYTTFGDPITNPKGWEVKSLGEVGRVITGNTPSTRDANNYASSDVCFFKPSDFDADQLSQLCESEFKISNYAYEQSRKLPKGAILTTCIGIVGKVGILKTDATCNQQINAIIPNELTESYYLGYAILLIKNLLSEKANAPVVPLLNKSQFSAVCIPLPPLSLQQSFAAQIEAIEQQKALIRRSLDETRTLLAARMQYYFE